MTIRKVGWDVSRDLKPVPGELFGPDYGRRALAKALAARGVLRDERPEGIPTRKEVRRAKAIGRRFEARTLRAIKMHIAEKRKLEGAPARRELQVIINKLRSRL